MITDEEELALSKQKKEFPRILDNMSIDELQEYIAEMKMEIERVEADIEKKQAQKALAESIFKS